MTALAPQSAGSPGAQQQQQQQQQQQHQSPQKLSRYRSMRRPATQPAPLQTQQQQQLQQTRSGSAANSPQSPHASASPSAMAAAAASASLQRSQSRYRRPTKSAGSAAAAASALATPPVPAVPAIPAHRRQTEVQVAPKRVQPDTRPPPLPQAPLPATTPHKPRQQHSQPDIRAATRQQHAPGTGSARADRVRQQTHPLPHGDRASRLPPSEQAALDRPKNAAEAARAEARRLMDMERARQRQMADKLQTEREAARAEQTRLKEQRAREALERAAEMDRLREAAQAEAIRLAEERANQPVISKEEKEKIRELARAETQQLQRDRAEALIREQERQAEIRREALRLQAEVDKRMEEAKQVREAEEVAQDERIRVLAKARYAEQLKDWQKKVEEQKAKDEKIRLEMVAKREEHRRQLEEKERKQEQKERKLAEKESQKNLRAAMGPKAAVGGTGGAHNLVRAESTPSESKLRTFASLRRRESDRPHLKAKRSSEVFDRVFGRRSDAGPTKETVGIKFEETTQREQPVFVKQSIPKKAAGVDAPISASNARERRVMVRCGKSLMALPITPTTTPVDLIYSASNVMSEDIDPKASVLQEHFTKAGVQRPLRKYEHVRDVLNSWDDDKQNVLALVPSETCGNDVELEAETVLNLEPPSDRSFFMHYSQKPGKWEKRYITIRTDGQVVHSKKESAKDITPICHMSDFDIYTPMPESGSKKINASKKHCFGIKSQQKSAMFLSTENFVHFFATNDNGTAASWYNAVQGWRSWYLVNVMGEGQASRLQPNAASNGLELNAQEAFAQGDKEASHYQIGSFQPLLDLGAFGAGPEAEQEPRPQQPLISAAHNADANHNRNVSMGQRSIAGPASSFRKPSVDDAGGIMNRTRTMSGASSQHHSRPSMSPEDSAFAATGLLGNAYAKRQRETEAAAAAALADSSGPFTEGPSLLNDMNAALLARSTTHASVSNRIGPGGMHKPLVDFSAEDPSAGSTGRPKGKGFFPETVGPNGLIDAVSSSTMSQLDRSKSVTRRPRAASNAARKQPTDLDSSDPNIFAAEGLLANAGYSQGGHTTGRGVATGGFTAASGLSAAGVAAEPLLDLGPSSMFAEKSLLRRAEQDGRLKVDGPVIDRSKQNEISVATGEGQ